MPIRQKIGICVIVGLISVFLAASASYACVGARPMAMGGAFIAVADDANATYWNPAGLAHSETSEFTYTPTLHNRDIVSYDDFLSFIHPFRAGTGMGISFINSGFRHEREILFCGIGAKEAWETLDRRFWLSYGVEVIDNLSVGTNLRVQHFEYRITGYLMGIPVDRASLSDAALAVDLALLWKLEKFSLGILWQNVNEPTHEFLRRKYVRNFRPGIAFRPDDRTIVAVDIYDVAGVSDVANNFCVGIERQFDLPREIGLDGHLTLRAGGYLIDGDGPMIYTFGFGFRGLPEENDTIDMQFDYTLLYWADVLGIDRFTHQIGLPNPTKLTSKSHFT